METTREDVHAREEATLIDRIFDRPISATCRAPLAVATVLTLVLGASTAWAGNVNDTDADLVPDAYDNCTTLANGPGEQDNQIDSDLDGFGNVCDYDYNNDGSVTTLDFSVYLDCFSGLFPQPICDHNGDGLTTTLDFTGFFLYFPGGAPGPSGLPCAGTVPCTP